MSIELCPKPQVFRGPFLINVVKEVAVILRSGETMIDLVLEVSASDSELATFTPNEKVLMTVVAGERKLEVHAEVRSSVFMATVNENCWHKVSLVGPPSEWV